jgi:acetyltransferase-like isoleucine patch superfamily enzyme
LAGDGSQIWTHGSLDTAKGKQLSVKIKDNIYIGSSVLIASGVTIENDTLIGLGSVVTQDITHKNTLVVGNPAKSVKENINWRENW